MAVPEEVSCILQLVSEYLKEPCPITSLSGSQGPTHPEGFKHPPGEEGEEGKGRRDAQQVRRRHLNVRLSEVQPEYRYKPSADRTVFWASR